MKLFEITNEDERQEFIKRVKHDCQPFLNAKHPSEVIYRGINAAKDYLFDKKVRKNRLPSNTPLDIHHVINEWFKKEFGYPYRSSGLFVTGSLAIAGIYGLDIYLVYPVEQFKFVWSPEINDLYSTIADLSRKRGIELKKLAFMDNLPPNEQEVLRDFVNNIPQKILEEGNYTDQNLSKAIKSKQEIMIAADSYHAAQLSDYDEAGREAFKLDMAMYQ